MIQSDEWNFFFDEGFYGVGFGDNDAAFYTVRKQLWCGYHTNFEAFSFCPIGNHLKDLLEKIGDMILNPEWPFSFCNKRR